MSVTVRTADDTEDEPPTNLDGARRIPLELPDRIPPQHHAGPDDTFPVVALVCSTGGLDALKEVFDQLPAHLGAAVLVLQHTSRHRPTLLAEILRGRTSLPVRLAREGDALQPNQVWVVPEGSHALVDGRGRLHIVRSDGAPRPSADILLCTLAVSLGPRVIAAILTGAGHDGGTGAAAVHACGGWIVAQDPATAQAPGMPNSAIERDDPCAVVPLSGIALVLTRLIEEVGHRSSSLPLPATRVDRSDPSSAGVGAGESAPPIAAG